MTEPRRPRALPRLMLPPARDRRLGSALVSAGLHGLIVVLLVAPIVWRQTEIQRIDQGAGGPGPAGGGGGGTRGTGGSPERLDYVRMAPPPPAAATAVPTAVLPPLVPPPVAPPVATPPQVVTPPVAPPQVAEATDRTATPAPVAGTGGGTGADGTAGSGPGSGGGVGSGVGTGRGSGNGPGTGGGTQANYPPTATEMFLPPFPTPANVRGFRLIAEFDIDEAGRVVDFRFTETRNGGYNRQLRDIFRQIKWRPGTRPDGTPVRMKAQIEYTF